MGPERIPPQPDPSRLTDFRGHPLVVAVTPGQPALVALTAASMARATGAPTLYFAYADAGRFAEEEYADGTVRHVPLNPDAGDDAWREVDQQLRAEIAEALEGVGIAWEFRYLAGRTDRALTHLARAVDAAAFVVGTHRGRHRRIAEFVQGTLALQLSHRQHRPVLVVPIEVVDWEGRAPWE